MFTLASRRLQFGSLLFSICLLGLLLLASAGGMVHAKAPSSVRATGTTVGSNNWTMYGYNAQHTDYNPGETLLGPSNVSQLTVAWNQPTANEPTTPLVVNGVVYVASGNQLYAFKMKTGQVIWQVKLNGAAPQLSPLFYNGVIYISPLYDNLYAYNASTGKLLWSAPDGGPSYANPTVVNGVIYTEGDNGTLYAINASTGKNLWSVSTSGGTYTSPSVANGVVYFGTGGIMYAYSVQSHARLWSYTLTSYIASTPAIAHGVVYFGGGDGVFYALNATNGKKLWSYTLGNAIAEQNATVTNGVVYIYAGYVLALNAQSGQKLWESAAGLDVFPPTGIAGANGVIYTGAYSSGSTRKAIVYAFNAKTGATLWTYTINGDLEALIPTVANGMLFVGFDFSLYAFHLPGH